MPHIDTSGAETPDPTAAETMDTAAAQRVEQEKLTRRAALRKLGFGAGIAAFSLLGVDDFARMVGQRLQRNAHDNKTAMAVAKEFQSAGIALADGTASGPVDPPCPGACSTCGEFYATQTGDIQKCQKACTACCQATPKVSLPCGTRADAAIFDCQQACAAHFDQPG